MALLQLTVIPLGTGTTGVGEYVAAVQRALEQENVVYQLNDMGTLIEGDATELFALMARIYEIPFRHGAQRVVTQMVIDDRRDKEIHIGDKIEAVRRKLEEGGQ